LSNIIDYCLLLIRSITFGYATLLFSGYWVPSIPKSWPPFSAFLSVLPLSFSPSLCVPFAGGSVQFKKIEKKRNAKIACSFLYLPNAADVDVDGDVSSALVECTELNWKSNKNNNNNKSHQMNLTLDFPNLNYFISYFIHLLVFALVWLLVFFFWFCLNTKQIDLVQKKKDKNQNKSRTN